MTGLIASSDNGHLDVVRALLQHGANVNATSTAVRERERERQADRQTDRQIDKEVDSDGARSRA